MWRTRWRPRLLATCPWRTCAEAEGDAAAWRAAGGVVTLGPERNPYRALEPISEPSQVGRLADGHGGRAGGGVGGAVRHGQWAMGNAGAVERKWVGGCVARLEPSVRFWRLQESTDERDCHRVRGCQRWMPVLLQCCHRPCAVIRTCPGEWSLTRLSCLPYSCSKCRSHAWHDVCRWTCSTTRTTTGGAAGPRSSRGQGALARKPQSGYQSYENKMATKTAINRSCDNFRLSQTALVVAGYPLAEDPKTRPLIRSVVWEIVDSELNVVGEPIRRAANLALVARGSYLFPGAAPALCSASREVREVQADGRPHLGAVKPDGITCEALHHEGCARPAEGVRPVGAHGREQGAQAGGTRRR